MYNIIDISEYLTSNGYSITNETNIDYSLIQGIKGKLFKTNILVYLFEIDTENDLENVLKTIESDNSQSLKVVFCNSNSDISNEKCSYMYNVKNGISIVHFVYYNKVNDKFTYDLDFHYAQSKELKALIKYVVGK